MTTYKNKIIKVVHRLDLNWKGPASRANDLQHELLLQYADDIYY